MSAAAHIHSERLIHTVFVSVTEPQLGHAQQPAANAALSLPGRCDRGRSGRAHPLHDGLGGSGRGGESETAPLWAPLAAPAGGRRADVRRPCAVAIPSPPFSGSGVRRNWRYKQRPLPSSPAGALGGQPRAQGTARPLARDWVPNAPGACRRAPSTAPR